MTPFNNISGYGNIYPAVCLYNDGDSTCGWYSEYTRKCHYRGGGGVPATTSSYKIIRNWSRNTSRSGNAQAHTRRLGPCHACVIPTSGGEVIGNYEVNAGEAYGQWGSQKYNIGGKGIIFINGH